MEHTNNKELNNKILKYKFKKKKIKKKINELLEKKQQQNNNYLKNLFNKTYFLDIINKLINEQIYPNINNNLFIIISGFNSVGKSMFIQNLENFISSSYTKNKIIIDSTKSFDMLNNYIFEHDSNEGKKIIYIETLPEITEKIYYTIKNNTFIPNNNIFIFYLIPHNITNYKNKLINTIFNMGNNNNTIYNIFTLLGINSNDKNNLNIINSLINKYPLVDNDFMFLDTYIETNYNKILEYKFPNDNIINLFTIYY